MNASSQNNMSHQDFLEMCQQQLERYHVDNIPIMDNNVILQLHEMYAGDDKQVIAYRGLLFATKEQTTKFENKIIDGVLFNLMPSALTTDKAIAGGFSNTQKTYNDMGMARESMSSAAKGEIVSGYEGALLTVLVNSKDCIDLSKAGMGAEGELLMLPSASAKIIEHERKIPLSRQFANRSITIDSVCNDLTDSSIVPLNYILINFSDQLNDSQINGLCNRFSTIQKQQQDSDDKKFLASQEGILVRAKNTNQIQYFQKTHRNLISRNDEISGVFVHPNGIILREWNTTERVNFKSVPKTVICLDANPSAEIVDLAKRNLLNSKQLEALSNQANMMCEAITDATKHEAFKATEIDHDTIATLRDFASPLALTIMSNAMSPDKGRELRDLDRTATIASNRDRLNHADNVKKAMEKLFVSIVTGKPSKNRPSPRP